MDNRLKIVFKTLDMEVDNYIKHYEWSDIYTEVKVLFTSYLGEPVKEQVDKYVESNPYTGDMDMKQLTLTYYIAWNEISHVESMIKMLNVLDVDCEFELVHEQPRISTTDKCSIN